VSSSLLSSFNVHVPLDLKTKHAIAGELRELIDSLTDGEFSQVLPHLVPTILEILRSGEVSFLKDSLDTQFRRILIEILHRIPHNDVVRNQVSSLLSGMLHILRHDNEDNGVTCCKAITDLLRSFKMFPADLISDFFSVLHDLLRNIQGLVDEVLSDDSPILDPNVMFPSIRSFKVLSEMCILTVTLVQVNKPLVASALQASSSLNFEVLLLESPSQKKTREEHEANGFIWSGMAPNIRNPQAYTDFIMCQIRVCVYIDFWRRILTSCADGILAFLGHAWSWRSIRSQWRETIFACCTHAAGLSR
jgi:transformation/transcription domain-associated protein